MAETSEATPITALEVRRVVQAGRKAIERFELGAPVLDAVAELELALDRERLVNLTSSLEKIQLMEQQFGERSQDHARISKGASDELLDAALRFTDQAQAGLRTVHQNAATIRRASIHPDVLQVAESVMDISKRFFASLERLRWRALEAQADADIRAGRVQKFETAEAAIASLRRAAR